MDKEESLDNSSVLSVLVMTKEELTATAAALLLVAESKEVGLRLCDDSGDAVVFLLQKTDA